MSSVKKDRKASQWAFTLPAYTDEDIARLSSACVSPDVLYITFTMLNDDTNNRYIEGFIKTAERFRVTKLVKLTGYALYTVVSTSGAVTDLLTEIQLNPEFHEFGDESVCNRAGHRNDIETFKRSVDMGILEFDLLKELHHGICNKYPDFARDYVMKKCEDPTFLKLKKVYLKFPNEFIAKIERRILTN